MTRFALLTGLLALAACKPPPTDADMARDMPVAAPSFASDPLPSPDTEGAMWAPSPQDSARLLYGVPSQPVLLTLACQQREGSLPHLSIARLAPADQDSSALLAMVGNGHIGRVPVEANENGGRRIWRGEMPAADLVWEPLAGPRQLTVTVPGAGMVTVNPSELPAQLIESCRAGEEFLPASEEADAGLTDEAVQPAG